MRFSNPKEGFIMMENMVAVVDNEVKDTFQFIFGGKAEFTIMNMDSKKGFKYKVTQCRDKKELFFVKVKDGAEWEYAGYITMKDEQSCSYKRGNKGTRDFNDPAINGLAWAVRKGHNPLPRPMIMMHHGKCACCGKKLDDAVSVARGFGPVCWDRLSKNSKDKIMEKSVPDMPFE